MWDERLPIQRSELGGGTDTWFRGCFHLTRDEWDGTTWVRDFDQLRRRDLTLFCLGDVRDKKILDVACGKGLYMVTLAKLGAIVSGQDISPARVEAARVALGCHGFDGSLTVGTATQLLFPAEHFDGVVSGDFVEHIALPDKRAFFREVFRVLKPGGLFVIKTPNLAWLRISINLKRLLAVLKGRSPFKVHIEHTRGNPDHEHLGLTTFSKLRDVLLDQMFHSPQLIRHPLSVRPLPRRLQEEAPNLPLIGPWLCRDLIIRTRKPIFSASGLSSVDRTAGPKIKGALPR